MHRDRCVVCVVPYKDSFKARTSICIDKWQVHIYFTIYFTIRQFTQFLTEKAWNPPNMTSINEKYHHNDVALKWMWPPNKVTVQQMLTFYCLFMCCHTSVPLGYVFSSLHSRDKTFMVKLTAVRTARGRTMSKTGSKTQLGYCFGEFRIDSRFLWRMLR